MASVHHISICITSVAMMTVCSSTRLHTIQECCLIQMQMTMEQGPSTIPPALPVVGRAACMTCPAIHTILSFLAAPAHQLFAASFFNMHS